MNTLDVVQGTDAWIQARLGKVTASRVSDVVARTKTGWGASRANYLAELVAERLTGAKAESYINAAMQWGTDHEEEARIAYEFRTDVSVEQVGFVEHPTIAMSGASPDGLVGDEGLVEIKAPNTATHLETLLGEKIPMKYIVQMQWQMATTGRKWCDFCSFDPRLPERLRLFVERVYRDDEMISDLEKHVIIFLAELALKIDALNKLYNQQAAA